MGRSQESFNKKEVRSKKDKKRKEKAQKKEAKNTTFAESTEKLYKLLKNSLNATAN